MSIQNWLRKNTSSLRNQTIAISGATGGIGKELCRYLCKLEASLILLDRNREKSMKLRDELLKQYPSSLISCITVDLENIYDVINAANVLKEKPLNGLILNAGAYCIPRHICSTGYDNIFQINFLSPYVLVRQLYSHLKKHNGKVVAVGSIAHTYSETKADDIDFRNQKKHSKAYGNAKRYLMFSLYGLYNGEDGLSITHPGITFTNITAHYPKIIFALIKHPMKIIFMRPRKACLSILRGLFDNCQKNQWIGPKYCRIWGLPKKEILKTCSEHEREWISDTADRLYKDLQI